mgnify:CR=1 FL=1
MIRVISQDKTGNSYIEENNKAYKIFPISEIMVEEYNISKLAKKYNVSEETVKKYIKQIFKREGAKTKEDIFGKLEDWLLKEKK